MNKLSKISFALLSALATSQAIVGMNNQNKNRQSKLTIITKQQLGTILKYKENITNKTEIVRWNSKNQVEIGSKTTMNLWGYLILATTNKNCVEKTIRVLFPTFEVGDKDKKATVPLRTPGILNGETRTKIGEIFENIIHNKSPFLQPVNKTFFVGDDPNDAANFLKIFHSQELNDFAINKELKQRDLKKVKDFNFNFK
jgi:hypothetical protein